MDRETAASDPSLRFEVLTPEALRDDARWWDIYQGSFPPDEREPGWVILRSLEMGDGLALRAVQAGQTLGIATGHLLRGVPSVFCPYIALAPESRGQGVGGALLDRLFDVGAARLRERGLDAIGLVWEVESLEHATPENEAVRRRRIGFFERQGGQLLSCRYIQPPVDGQTLVPMHLMFKPGPAQGLPDAALQHALIKAMYFEKYGGANQISEALLSDLFRTLYPL